MSADVIDMLGATDSEATHVAESSVPGVQGRSHGRLGELRSPRCPWHPLLVLAIFALAGCTAPTVDQSLTATTGGAEFAQQMAFWSQLHDQPVVSNDDAFHALLLSFQPDNPAGDYAARVEAMRAAGLLADGFDGAADEAVTRGVVAVAIARHLNLEGGVVMRLFGPTPRYATRELQYVGVFPPSSPGQVFSGAQLVAILGRVEDYARREKQFRPADEMPEGVPVAEIRKS